MTRMNECHSKMCTQYISLTFLPCLWWTNSQASKLRWFETLPTDWLNDLLTGVGSRATCIAKKSPMLNGSIWIGGSPSSFDDCGKKKLQAAAAPRPQSLDYPPSLHWNFLHYPPAFSLCMFTLGCTAFFTGRHWTTAVMHNVYIRNLNKKYLDHALQCTDWTALHCAYHSWLQTTHSR